MFLEHCSTGLCSKKAPVEFRLGIYLTPINDDIEPALCSVMYASFGAAESMIRSLGPAAKLAKSYIIPVQLILLDRSRKEAKSSLRSEKMRAPGHPSTQLR